VNGNVGNTTKQTTSFSKIVNGNVGNTTKQTIYHLPRTTDFKNFNAQNQSWSRIPLSELLDIVDNNIAKYGYAVIVLHPQDLAKMGADGKLVNVVDDSEVKDLSNLIDLLLLKNIHITSFSKIVNGMFKSTSVDSSSTVPYSAYCRCVIFRLDDVQDNYLQSAQLAQMNLFISKNQSLSLGIIMSGIGNDTNIIDKVREGDKKGLFELAVEGWKHVDYTKLNEQEQKDTLIKANEKMQKLFGHKSDIFITPFGTFNNDTITAMSQLGLRILSVNS
jgi:hypothetical protein